MATGWAQLSSSSLQFDFNSRYSIGRVLLRMVFNDDSQVEKVGKQNQNTTSCHPQNCYASTVCASPEYLPSNIKSARNKQRKNATSKLKRCCVAVYKTDNLQHRLDPDGR